MLDGWVIVQRALASALQAGALACDVLAAGATHASALASRCDDGLVLYTQTGRLVCMT
jgi:hypothetical protein